MLQAQDVPQLLEEPAELGASPPLCHVVLDATRHVCLLLHIRLLPPLLRLSSHDAKQSHAAGLVCTSALHRDGSAVPLIPQNRGTLTDSLDSITVLFSYMSLKKRNKVATLLNCFQRHCLERTFVCSGKIGCTSI